MFGTVDNLCWHSVFLNKGHPLKKLSANAACLNLKALTPQSTKECVKRHSRELFCSIFCSFVFVVVSDISDNNRQSVKASNSHFWDTLYIVEHPKNDSLLN